MASAVMANNGSFTSPLADAKLAQFVGHPQIDSVIARIFQLSPWTVALTILLGLVAYDQCKKPVPAMSVNNF
jgi:C-22 sterol desaturase